MKGWVIFPPCGQHPHLALSLIANFELVKPHVNRDQKTLVARANVTPVLQVEYDCNDMPTFKLKN
jgi:hypothetical protein